MTPDRATYAFLGGLSSFITFAVYIVFMLVILVAVRPKRPDASGMLVVSSVVFLVSHVVMWFFSFLMPIVAEHSGAGISMIYAYPMLSSFLHVILNGIGMACLMMGLVKIAAPPGGDPRPLHLPPGG